VKLNIFLSKTEDYNKNCKDIETRNTFSGVAFHFWETDPKYFMIGIE
jgi:hypothetical protein